MKPTLLGFGAMRLPTDVNECTKMFASYLESGGNYIDTAYVYGGSEEMLKRALTSKHPRERYLLSDKLPPWSVNSIKDCDRILKESLNRCGVDYFDYYLLHALDEGNEKKLLDVGAYEWAQEQKKKGLVREVGFSFHDTPEFLEVLLNRHPEMEFVMLQLNYVDILRGIAGSFHESALKHKIPLFVMEPIKGGTLAHLPAEAEALLKAARPDHSIAAWAMRYAASLEGAVTTISGMSSLDQVLDNNKTFYPFEPMTAGDYELIDKALDILSKEASIPCTACKYCLAECPLGIPIDHCISLYNETIRAGEKFNRSVMYRGIPEGKRAGDCTGCAACNPRCPQKIDIVEALKTVAAEFA